jgi:hypothetical protein
VRLGDAAERAEPFDPSEEYRRLLDLTAPDLARVGMRHPRGAARTGRKRPVRSADPKDPGDVYQDLMARERRVLDTVDRVVNDASRERREAGTLAGMPVHEVVMRTVSAVTALFEDLVVCRSLEDLRAALAVEPARRPFLGIALVALAILLGMVHIAT